MTGLAAISARNGRGPVPLPSPAPRAALAAAGAGIIGLAVGFGAQTACHNDFAVFAQRLADGIKAFGFGAIKKPAGIHDNGFSTRIVRADCITFGPQAGQDAFAIDQRFGATKADHANRRLARARGVGDFGFGCEVGAQVWRILCHVAHIARAMRRGKRVTSSASF